MRQNCKLVNVTRSRNS